jgi:hypothetical protein
MLAKPMLFVLTMAAGFSLTAAANAQDDPVSQRGGSPAHMAPPMKMSPPHATTIGPSPVRPPHWVPTFHFEHHDFAHFTSSERARWTSGHWSYGWHHHRHGWWWFVGGVWFFYDEPIWPYPTLVSAEYVEEAPDQYYGQYWYYCDDPKGYWPYVQACNVPWEAVPVTPPNQISSDDVE